LHSAASGHGISRTHFLPASSITKDTKAKSQVLFPKNNRNRQKQHLVLTTGLGNPPAVVVRNGKIIRFGSRPVHKPNALLVGGPNTDLTHQPTGCARFGKTCSVQSRVLLFRWFYLWLHLHILLVIAQDGQWYVTAFFGCTGSLYRTIIERHTLGQILEMSAPGAFTICCLASWAI